MLRRTLANLWVILVFLAILGVGLGGGMLNARQQDAERRAVLLKEAQYLAQTIDPDLVRLLTFSPADVGSPAFERLGAFFAAYARLRPLYRGIYTMALRGDRLLFGPESYPPDDPMALPPGTVYLEPGEEDFRVLREGVGYVGGPESDEYGTFVFALAPVRDPLTGQVLMAVGIDVLAEDWQAEMRKAYRVPLIFASLADLVFVASVWAFRRRARVASYRRWWHYLEVAVILAYGVLFAALVAWITARMGAIERAHLFEMLTDARAAAARTAFTRMKNNLEAVQRFFLSSEDVRLDEFENFIVPLAQAAAVDSYLWIPKVSQEEVETLSQAAHKEGLRGFTLWEFGAEGEPRPVSEREHYYPILYIGPLEGREAMQGLDLGAMPQCRAAMEEAARTGLGTLADFIFPGQGNGEEILWHAFLPVSLLEGDLSNRGLRQGFVAAAFRPQRFWETVLWAGDYGNSVLTATWVDLESGRPMAQLPAGANEEAFSIEEVGSRDRYVQVIPLLVFDRPMLLVFRPLPAFFALRPARMPVVGALGVMTVASLLAGIVGVLRQRQEVLERLVAERTAALSESQQRLQMLFDNALDAFVLVDDAGRFVEVNPAACSLFNRSRQDFLGRSWQDVVDEKDREEAQALWRRLLERGSLEGEYKVEDVIIEFRAVANVSPGLHFVVLRDITERKRAEANRREMERLLFEAQKLESLGILAGGIAHDFNNLLAAILGNIELAMLDLSPDSSAQAVLKEALRASQRAADLTRQMLAYSGKGRFVLAHVDLNALIQENAEMLRVAIPRHVTLSLDLTPNLPRIEADPGQIQQVIMNLIINAAEAIGDKPGVVTLATGVANYDAETLAHSRTVERPAPGRYVWISAADTGAGMSPETLGRIFEPFFTTKATGRGLGMAAVLGIVRGHKGAIWVESTPGRGTTVRVAFPAVGESPQSEEAQAPTQEILSSQGTILVVDDEEMVRRLTCRALERAGWRTLSASNGEEACALYAAHQTEIDAVVLDLTMPGMNGLEALKALREINPRVRILLCSGYGEEEVSRQVADKSHLGFLQKPFNRESLLAALAQVLGS